MSNLVEHARRELVLIGEDPMTISGYLDVIQAFADMGHSGGSAPIMIANLTKLLYFKPLSALTDNPDEWMNVSAMSGQDTNLWQSVRDPECFSTDGGKTYYCLSERDVDPTSLHISIPYIQDPLPEVTIDG